MRFFFVVEWAFVGVSMEYLGSSWESLVFGYSCFCVVMQNEAIA